MPKAPSLYADAPRLPDTEALDLRELFGRTSVELEIGPGRGGFVFERAAAAPQSVIVGLEIRRKWAKIVDDRLRASGLASRARVFAEDAKAVLPRLVSASLTQVFLHFPDPWWKKRHAKRLVLGDVSLGEITRCLRPGGQLFIQTDVEERALAYAEQIGREPSLRPVGASARQDENPYEAQSPREKRAIKDGLPIYRLWYAKL